MLLAVLVSACTRRPSPHASTPPARATTSAPATDPTPGNWRGDVQLPFAADLHWKKGSGGGEPPELTLDEADITSNVGRIVYKGKPALGVLGAVQKAGADVFLGGILATTSDNVIVISFLCKSGQVVEIEVNSLTDPFDDREIKPSGTCGVVDRPTRTNVAFTPWVGPPSDRLTFPKIGIDGSKLRMTAGSGSAELGGVEHRIDVMGIHAHPVGWEVYTTLRRGSELRFGVLYLAKATPNRIKLKYGFRLDAPGFDPPETMYDASWRVDP